MPSQKEILVSEVRPGNVVVSSGTHVVVVAILPHLDYGFKLYGYINSGLSVDFLVNHEEKLDVLVYPEAEKLVGYE